jgi:hypothetical protein
MAAYVPTPNVVQVSQFFSSGVSNAANIWHVVKAVGGITVADLNSIIDVFEAWENLTGKATRAIETACTGFKATDLSSLSGGSIFRGENIVGSVAHPAAPANTTFAIKLSTGKRGRGTNGRVFWYGLDENSVDYYSMTSAAADALKIAVDQLISTLEATGDFKLCVPHSVVNGVKINPRTNDVVVSAAYTDLFLDSQKDRLPGHKRQKRKKIVPTP